MIGVVEVKVSLKKAFQDRHSIEMVSHFCWGRHMAFRIISVTLGDGDVDDGHHLVLLFRETRPLRMERGFVS